MKIRTIEGIAVLAGLLLAISSLSFPVLADSSAGSSLGPDQTFSFVGQLSTQYNSTAPYILATFLNQSPYPVNGTVYAVMKNIVTGETVYIASSPFPVVNPGQSSNVALFLPIPPDVYTVNIFVVSSLGVGLSLDTNATLWS